ncbi:MAG: hypothetical protein AAB401_06370 [Acidobacteriota bacterium]
MKIEVSSEFRPWLLGFEMAYATKDEPFQHDTSIHGYTSGKPGHAWR